MKINKGSLGEVVVDTVGCYCWLDCVVIQLHVDR